MKDQIQHLAVEIELQPGEKLALPAALIDSVGAGRWLVTIEPAGPPSVRDHGAFLKGYALEDEGLYDDDPGG
jgi:hypothetical protein